MDREDLRLLRSSSITLKLEVFLVAIFSGRSCIYRRCSNTLISVSSIRCLRESMGKLQLLAIISIILIGGFYLIVRPLRENIKTQKKGRFNLIMYIGAVLEPTLLVTKGPE